MASATTEAKKQLVLPLASGKKYKWNNTSWVLWDKQGSAGAKGWYLFKHGVVQTPPLA